ncbi:MAG: deoxyribodipyrimidine photo-lyase [Bacteroidales bacterium]
MNATSDPSPVLFWFRRDLRLNDNTGLNRALAGGKPVQCVFLFDTHILEELPRDDARVGFIHETLQAIHTELVRRGSSLRILHGEPETVWANLAGERSWSAVYANRDYEPYATERDQKVAALLKTRGIPFVDVKDQVIFERDEIVKADGTPYTVFTPYKRRWLEAWNTGRSQAPEPLASGRFLASQHPFPSLESLGFRSSAIRVPPYRIHHLESYAATRDLPAEDGTSRLSPHLRFGTVGIRQVIADTREADDTFRSELIWREFFMQILHHFPRVVDQNFHRKYDGIAWRNRDDEFQTWCAGRTGYPLVDAGMRQLNATGLMHNRVRMVCASFLTKHLLIDWRWGEAYFAEKLLDFELSSNNGNWQWAAGTGCDAAPYFRVFNPLEQHKRFDPGSTYVRRWIPELDSPDYPRPLVDHKYARERALQAYKAGLSLAVPPRTSGQ